MAILDQSFSAENFRQILDYENRKGIYLEGRYFSNIAVITQAIKNCNIEIREKKKLGTGEDFEIFRKKMNERKEKLKEEKESKLLEALQKVSENIVAAKFTIQLTQNYTLVDKPVYTTTDTPENYFALKQLQYNFRKLYKVKQANRFAILSQMKVLLDDTFPKYVIRTDIKEFYESIPHDKLFQKLNQENLMTFFSKKILFQILNEYKRLSGSDVGLPRGVGVSAYLAELYMRDVDNSIKSLPSVSYYARYVDDIIIIFTPYSSNEPKDYLNKIDEIIETKYSLKTNKAKTQEFDLVEAQKRCCLQYLGYNFQFGNDTIKLSLSKNKINRYKYRIDLIFQAYSNYSKIKEKKARKLLVKRVKFLTGNTRLLNNKKNILVGVYYSNNLLSEDSDFIGLDKYLAHKIETVISFPPLKKRLGQFKFQEGFSVKRFTPFTPNDLSSILAIWQND